MSAAHEGAVSGAIHLLLAVLVGLQFYRDPLGNGALTLMTFGFAETVVKTVKVATKRLAILCGNDGPDAFWRRPPQSKRGEGSPGFPSAHAADCGAICVFALLSEGLQPAFALLPTLVMAGGRLSDHNHTALQTAAGVVLGPPLGWLWFQLTCVAWQLGTPPHPWWWLASVAVAVLGGVGYGTRVASEKLELQPKLAAE